MLSKKEDAVAVLIGFVLTFLLQLLFVKASWNHVMPELFKLPTIGWGQAFWVNLLASSLFKTFNTKVKAGE